MEEDSEEVKAMWEGPSKSVSWRSLLVSSFIFVNCNRIT